MALTSSYNGKCATCGERYPKGTRIESRKGPSGNLWSHVECLQAAVDAGLAPVYEPELPTCSPEYLALCASYDANIFRSE